MCAYVWLYIFTLIIWLWLSKKDNFLSAHKESCMSFRQDLVRAEETGKWLFIITIIIIIIIIIIILCMELNLDMFAYNLYVW